MRGYLLKVAATSGNLVVRPNSDNALTVITEESVVRIAHEEIAKAYA